MSEPRKPVQAPKRRGESRPPSPSTTGDRRTVYVIVAIAILAAAVLAVGVTVSGDDGGADIEPGVETIATGIEQNGLVLGDPDAPVTIAEYADIQCPFCAELAAELPEVVDRYVRDGRVKLELRGLAFIGEDSREGMEFVYAAAEKNKAWDVVDLLYQSQGPENSGWVDEDLLTQIAEGVGLDAEQTLERAQSDEVGEEIDAEAARAEKLEISSTPTLLIGKSGGELRRIELESLDAEVLFPIIDEELAAG